MSKLFINGKEVPYVKDMNMEINLEKTKDELIPLILDTGYSQLKIYVDKEEFERFKKETEVK